MNYKMPKYVKFVDDFPKTVDRQSAKIPPAGDQRERTRSGQGSKSCMNASCERVRSIAARSALALASPRAAFETSS